MEGQGSDISLSSSPVALWMPLACCGYSWGCSKIAVQNHLKEPKPCGGSPHGAKWAGLLDSGTTCGRPLGLEGTKGRGSLLPAVAGVAAASQGVEGEHCWVAVAYSCPRLFSVSSQTKKHIIIYIRSDQISRSVLSDSLRPHESQHARPPCPSPPTWLISNFLVRPASS